MMKRTIIAITVALSVAAACERPVDPTPEASVVVLPDGPVVLQDTEFGMYYGNQDNDGTGVFSIVLSDARCYRDDLSNPYLDSEGDMVVLRIKTPLLSEEDGMTLPSGEYPVSMEAQVNTVDAAASYVRRQVGSMQSRWDIKAGSVNVARDENGEYQITTNELVIAKDELVDTVEYVCYSSIKVDDYMTAAPAMLSTSDDIIDMPFPDFECIYNGDLFGNGAGNFIVNMSTKGFVTPDGEVMDIPGIYITLNFFSRLYSGNSEPVLEEGRYTVSTMTSSSLFSRWTILPGLMMDGTPFGSYVLQQPSDGEGTMEFIASGVVDVKYDESEDATKAPKARKCTLTYTLKTSGRTISGEWTGEILVDNQSATSNESFLTTLDHDVECDMSKVTEGSLHLIETLHRNNIEEEWDYDIAEAWQLYLQPRDWTSEEYAIPWVDPDNPLGADGISGTEDDYMYDKNNNGIRDRLEAHCGDGDVMILEFVLPLGSQGVIAPELGKTYTYTMQPNLAATEEMYEIYVSRMGRPADEIFDPFYAEQHPGWAEGIGITSYDRCNARRGFTWASDGYRGNWYLHYEKDRHMIVDGHAPAVNGWVKVTRTADDIYDFEWDLIDDNPGTPNKITGSLKDCKVSIHLN